MIRFFLSKPINAFCLIILSGSLLLSFSPSWANERSKLDSIRAKIDEIRVQLSGKESERNRVIVDLKERDAEIARVQQKINAIASQRKKISANIQELEEQQIILADEKKQLQQSLTVQLEAAYKTGKQSKLKMMLSQKNPEHVGRLLSYHKYLNIAREEKIIALQNTIESLKSLADEIEKETWQLALNEEELSREKSALASAKAKKKMLLRKLESDIGSQNQKLDSLAKDQRRLQQLMTRLDTQPNKPVKKQPQENQHASSNAQPTTSISGTKFANSKGRLGWPVNGKLKHGYGSTIQGNIRRTGVFISAADGSSVKAVQSGQVVYSDWFNQKGLMIVINHGDGYMSLYAHNQNLLVSEGEMVKAGQRIARSGQTGNTSTSGLYFEIRRNRTPLNPMSWLQK